MNKVVFRNYTGRVAQTSMKRLFRIFHLSKNEQRVVLIVMLILIAVAFIGYERRVHRVQVRALTATEVKTSPTPVQTEDEQ